MRFIITFLYLFLVLSFPSIANTFIVTSNADDGPGSLRDAVQQASDNGFAEQDIITFNLPDISRTGRTIILFRSLPNLSSNLIIDGTTQNGAPFGISNARVQIENRYVDGLFTCFTAVQVSDIEIYGLYLKGNFVPWSGLDFKEANNIRFGSPGKGNIVNGFSQAVSGFPDGASNNIIIQGNLMGIDESGDMADKSTYNVINFAFQNVNNLLIGGLNSGEGNLLCDKTAGMSYDRTNNEDGGYLKILGNKIGTDWTGLKRLMAVLRGFEYLVTMMAMETQREIRKSILRLSTISVLNP